MVLWVNLHGGWVQGVALLAMVAAGEALAWLRGRVLGAADRALPGRAVLALGALVPVGVLATLVNPYGARAAALPFELTGMTTFMARIYEWQPPYAASFHDTTMLPLYVVLLVALVTALTLAELSRPGRRCVADGRQGAPGPARARLALACSPCGSCRRLACGGVTWSSPD